MIPVSLLNVRRSEVSYDDNRAFADFVIGRNLLVLDCKFGVTKIIAADLTDQRLGKASRTAKIKNHQIGWRFWDRCSTNINPVYRNDVGNLELGWQMLTEKQSGHADKKTKEIVTVPALITGYKGLICCCDCKESQTRHLAGLGDFLREYGVTVSWLDWDTIYGRQAQRRAA